LVSFGASYIYARGKVDWDKAVTQLTDRLILMMKKQADTVMDLVSISDLIRNWM
jgi:hypothetical protein